MKHISKIVACATLALAAIPATASATMPLRNSAEIGAFQARYGLAKTGVMDSSTKACAWQRACPSSAASSAPTSSGEPSICHNGILSDDAGQGCSDGLYQRVYGSSSSTPAPAPAAAPAPVSSPTVAATTHSGGNFQAIRQCESGGNYSTNTGNGYYGAYQFSQSTWNSVGGSGNPAAASPAEQDRRAAILYSRTGPSSWPVCGR